MSATKYFNELLPERIHEAFAEAGITCQPAVRFLNSMENRVAKVFDEEEEPWVAKFYRPGRWSTQAIQEEHDFLYELQAADLPVFPPIRLQGGQTIGTVANIYFAIFPFGYGRPPDELELSHVRILGELLARVHEVGQRKPSKHRPYIAPDRWGAANLELLRRGGQVPENIWPRYERAATRLIERTSALFEEVEFQRLHGDCHRGNLLWSSQGPAFVDFDDTSMGPPVQDVWMLVPGRDNDAIVLREALLEAYERRRPFDRKSLRLIEPLRGLRFIHYAAWLIARRDDPAIRRVFHDVGTREYWRAELEDLEAQVERVEESVA
ncbi:MAG: serine/threonine protein kinase [Armatimonadetes bacterium]|nr:serine/threonine protein kinase [Armatimonadota bacterium]